MVAGKDRTEGIGICTCAHQRTGEASPGKSASFCGGFTPFFRPLPGRLDVVVTLAKALVIGWVDKLGPVAPERDHVVGHRGVDPFTLSGALPAERLPEELCRPQDLCPDGQVVPTVILRACPPVVLGPVLVAPARAGHLRAPRMLTRSQRFTGHPRHLRAKEKAGANDHAFLRLSLAPAFKALAFAYFDFDFAFAIPAPQRNLLSIVLWIDSVQPLVKATVRTGKVPIFYD